MTSVFCRARIDREKLREIILKNPEYLQPGLRIIDASLDTAGGKSIDYLGVDTHGRLHIIDFDVFEHDAMLLAAFSQAQWIKKTLGLLKRLFFSENIRFSLPPVIVLIAPSFSPALQAAVRNLCGAQIRLVSYAYLTAHGQDAIIFEEAAANISRDAPEKREKEEIIAPPNPPSFISQESELLGAKLAQAVELTPEEIAEFMNFDRPEKNGNSAA